VSLVLFAILLTASQVHPSRATVLQPGQNFQFQTMINASPLVIRGESRFAGAVSSMTFRGQEYVNRADHGRLFQGAIAFNGRYECFNPTQGGASLDRRNFAKRSSSKRLRVEIAPEGYIVSTRMAYWLRPGQYCAIGDLVRVPVDNRKRQSDVVYTISNRIGAAGLANAVAMQITYAVPTPQQSAVVEAATLYTPPEFNTFHLYDLSEKVFTLDLTLRSDESSGPVVISTEDGAHAFAFVSASPGATYGRWRFEDTNKISLVYRPKGAVGGVQVYDGYWAVGTREEVMDAVRHLKMAAP
jgi:hypothetical protein